MIAHNSKAQDSEYLRAFIMRALMGEPVPQPDRARLNGNYESVYALYAAWNAGGAAAVQSAWQVIKVQRPQLVQCLVEAMPLIIHADDLKNLSAPVYMMDGYPIYTDAFNLLIGPSGSGKSFVALDISGRIAAQCVKENKGKTVVYVAGEGLHGYSSRWEAWKDHHKIKAAELYFYREAIQVIDAQRLEEFIALIAEHNPSFVVIDTFARSAIGVDENSAKEMGQFIGACDAIRAALQCALLVVHHTGKNGQIRGSSALYGAADSVLSVIKTEERIGLYNDPEHGGKNKYSASADPKFFLLKPHDVGNLSGAVLIPAEQQASQHDDPERKLSASGIAILDALEGYEDGLTAKELIDASQIKQGTAYRVLKTLKKAGYVTFADSRYTITEAGNAALEY